MKRKVNLRPLLVSSVAVILCSSNVYAQSAVGDLVYIAPYETSSVGRGAPFVDPGQYSQVGAAVGLITGATPGQAGLTPQIAAQEIIAARDGAAPEGIEPLAKHPHLSVRS